MQRGLRHSGIGFPLAIKGGVAKPNGAPSGLVLTTVDDTTLTVSFSSTSTNQDGYRAYISSDGGVTYPTSQTNAATTFNLTGLIAATLYYVYIVAYKRSQESAASNIASAYTLPSLSHFLFWGKYSEISGGQMPNKITGATDYLTIAGVAGSETYQAPHNATYEAADTDYIWFKTDSTQRTTTTAELIGYDLQRTPVKYDDNSPYQIREIIILKAGETLTASERNIIFQYMWLPILWDNNLNAYGHIKGNRIGQNLWYPIIDILTDGNNVAWYDSSDVTNITKDGFDYVSLWKDKLSSGHDLVGGGGTKNPLWGITGILFDGSNDVMQALFTYNRPTTQYIVLQNKSWTTGKYITDGGSNYSALLLKGSTPNIEIYAGADSGQLSYLTLNVWGVVTIIYNGATSLLQVNALTAWTGNSGTVTSLGGFTIGGYRNLTINFTNIEVKEIILRAGSDTPATRTAIYNYLKGRYSL